MLEMSTSSHWAIPFFEFHWEDHDQHRDALKAVCHRREAANNQSGVAPGVKRGLYESDLDFCSEDDDSVRAFSAFAAQAIFQAAQMANEPYWPSDRKIQVMLNETWCHITRTGGYHDTHHHPNHSWSAVYYLDIGDVDIESKSGLTRFYRPLDPAYQDVGTMWYNNHSSIDVHCQNGMLWVFPSWLMHTQLPYFGEKDRYVIAINSKLRIKE